VHNILYQEDMVKKDLMGIINSEKRSIMHTG